MTVLRILPNTCVVNTEFRNVTAGGAYYYHWVLDR